MELARITSRPPEVTDDLFRDAVHDPHHLVGSVCDIQVALPAVGREIQLPRGSEQFRLRCDGELAEEGAVLLEDLDPVVRPVAHVDAAIVGDTDAVDRDPELALCGRVVIGKFPIGAPVPPVLACVRIEDDHSSVRVVAVCDVHLVRLRVDDTVGGPPQQVGVVWAAGLPGCANLKDEVPRPA